ncbi:hypothetical protein Tco_1458967 [Tanacetum coccineum]
MGDSRQIIATMEVASLQERSKEGYQTPVYIGFQYSVENVVDHLHHNWQSLAIPGERSEYKRQRSRKKWSTLGEPSEKWDYYVKYDAPPDTTPIEEIAELVGELNSQNDEVNQEEFREVNMAINGETDKPQGHISDLEAIADEPQN